MEKEVLREGSGERAHEYWKNAAEAHFKFKVYRATGEVLDDSETLCTTMDTPGVFTMLLDKKFKVEVWETYLRTMKRNEKARFSSSEKEHCVQYVAVSRMLRDLKNGKKSHGCMGGMNMLNNHGHSHDLNYVDELHELISNPEELTFEFELLNILKKDKHTSDVWAMNKTEQQFFAPKFKEEGGAYFKEGNYEKAGEAYEKSLKCIDLIMSSELKSNAISKTEKEKLLNNLSECLLRLERWREAEKRATEVLDINPSNEKALWRRGKARRQLHEVGECRQDFMLLTKLNKSMQGAVTKELAQLDKTLQARDKALKSGLKNMF